MKGKLWILAVPALLLPVVVLNVVMLIKSSGSNAVAVEPDYYNKAVHWDEHLREQENSRALGWKLELGLVPESAGVARLNVMLRDSAARPVEGAEVKVEAFHNALSDQRLELTLVGRDSVYTSPLELARPGLWEFRLRASRGVELYTSVRRLDLSPSLFKGE